MREIDPADVAAWGQTRRGTQPQHCGQPAHYEDSGIWLCLKCDSSGSADRPGGTIRKWNKPNYSPIDYGRN